MRADNIEDIHLEISDPPTQSELDYYKDFLQKLETSPILILDSKTTAETPADHVKLAQNYIEKFKKYSPYITTTTRAFIFHKDGHFDVVGYDPSSPADDQKFKLFKIRGDGLCSVTAAIVAENFINTGIPIRDDDQFIQHLNGKIDGYEGNRGEISSPTLNHYQIKRPDDNRGQFAVEQEVISVIANKYNHNHRLAALLSDYSTTDNYLTIEDIKALLISSRRSALEDADFVGNAVWQDIKTEISIPELKLTEKQANRIRYLNHFTNGYRTHNLASDFVFEYFFPSAQEISILEAQGKNYFDTARLNSLTTFFNGFIEDAGIEINRLNPSNDESLRFSSTAAVNMHKAMVFLNQAGLQVESVIKVSRLTEGFMQILSQYYDKILENAGDIKAEHLIAIQANLKDFKDPYAQNFCQTLQGIIASKNEAPSPPPIHEDPSWTEGGITESARRRDGDEEDERSSFRPCAPFSPPLPAKSAVKKTQSFQDIYDNLNNANYDEYLQTTSTKLTHFSPSSTSPIQTSYDLVPDYLKPIPTKQYKGWGLVFKISDDNKSITIIKVAQDADGEIKKLQDKVIFGIGDKSIEKIINECHQKKIDPTYKITSLFRLNNTLTLRDSENQNIDITQEQKKIYQLKTTKTSPDISDPSSYSLELSTSDELSKAKQQDFEKLQTVHDIFAHINNRFDLLETMLRENQNLKIVMPAITPGSTSPAPDKDFNLLGRGHAIDQWKTFFSNHNRDNPDQATKESENIVKKMHELFRSRHAKLNEEFNTDQLNPRIIQDAIYPSHNQSLTPAPSAYCLHIWGANANNWNLDENAVISGGGMAANLGMQRQGLFGIVTTPIAGINKILEADKTYQASIESIGGSQEKKDDSISISTNPEATFIHYDRLSPAVPPLSLPSSLSDLSRGAIIIPSTSARSSSSGSSSAPPPSPSTSSRSFAPLLSTDSSRSSEI